MVKSLATILVDYENVSTTEGLKGAEYLNENDTLIIFYSQCCEKIRAEYIELIEQSQCEFKTYKLARIGKNALDFHIAYYLGIKSSEEVYHYILSKDKGYDPLIASINKNSKRIIAKRIISLDDLQVNEEKSISPEYKILVNKINTFAKSKRPKSESKLKTFIQNQIFPNMKVEEIMNLIEEMYRNKFISKGQNNIISY